MSTPPTPRAAATEVRRRQILDAALRCFNRAGLAETKMGDICAEAAVSTGSVYHHFAGKDQLAAALYLEGSRDYQQGLLAELQRHATAERGIRAMVAHHIDWVVRHPDWARFLSQHRQSELLGAAQPELDVMSRSFHGEVAAWLLPFIERGEVARLPRDLFTPVAMGPTLEYMARWLTGGEQGDPRRATQVLATAAWNAVRVRRSEAPSASAVVEPKRRAARRPSAGVGRGCDRGDRRGAHGDRGRRRRSRGRGRLHLRRREGDARDRALHDTAGRRPVLHADRCRVWPRRRASR